MVHMPMGEGPVCARHLGGVAVTVRGDLGLWAQVGVAVDVYDPCLRLETTSWPCGTALCIQPGYRATQQHGESMARAQGGQSCSRARAGR